MLEEMTLEKLIKRLKVGVALNLGCNHLHLYSYSCRFGTCEFSIAFWAKKQTKIPTR